MVNAGGVDDSAERVSLAEYLAAAIGFAGAVVVLCVPVFLRPLDEVFLPVSSLVRPVARWVMWVLAWGTHALVDASATVFDANVFHPVANAAAFGDSLVGVLPLFAPVYLATGNPVFAYQFALLATLALCGAGMYALARHWGCGALAAVIAGGIYAICPARLAVLAELPYVSGQYLPLALIFADRVMVRPRPLNVLALFVCATWQILCGDQLAYAALVVLAAYVVLRALLRAEPLSVRGLALAVCACLVAVGVFWALHAPYRALQQDGLYAAPTMYDFPRIDARTLLRTYLVPPFLPPWQELNRPYVGVSVLVLVLAGIVTGLRRPLVWRLLAVAALCYWMSLGAYFAGGVLAPYRWALDWIPGFAALGPTPTRFAEVAMVALSPLAGLGVQSAVAVLGKRTNPVFALIFASVCAACILLDFRLPRRRLEVQRIAIARQQMPLYDALATMPPGPVVELPVNPCVVNEGRITIDRQLGSTLHWQPLIDGFSTHGRTPTVFETVRAMANALPDPRALDWLRRVSGVRYVLVHLTDRAGDWRRRWGSVEGMTRLGFYGHDLLFEISGDDRGELLDELLALPRSATTLAGAAVEMLEESQRQAEFSFARLPGRIAEAGQFIAAEVRVTNRSPVTWPVLTTDVMRKVYLSYMWTDENGELVAGDGRAQALPFDLAAGESVVVPVCIETPLRAGEAHLTFGLSQAEKWFPTLSHSVRIDILG